MTKQKLLSLFLALLLLVGLAIPAGAYTQEQEDAADELYERGLFYGTDQGYELDRALTRQEAVTMLVRLVGRETAALNGNYRTNFTDVDLWATGYVGYAETVGLVSGYSVDYLGAADSVTPEQYLTFVLRALGYSDVAGDFAWDAPWPLAISLGLAAYEGEFSSPLTRGEVALISQRALSVYLKGSTLTLWESLEIAQQAETDAALTPAQIYRKCADAVFFLESYEDSAYETPYGTASGFFISSDGIAVTNYHALIDTGSARITTRDGETYPVTHILYGSTTDDVIVMQVATTAESGKTVQSFPYLELADQSSVRVGDPIYAFGSPLGLSDTFASGIVSSLNRRLGSRTYIQMTVPISSGSSGGPVVDATGKVIGIASASFTSGQNLNLANPVNVIKQADWSGTGTEYAPFFADREYHITAAPSAVTVKVDETVTVIVGSDYPFSASLMYENYDFATVAVSWGNWVDEQHVQLFITGVSEGEGEIFITFDGIKSDAQLLIPVTVLPGDDVDTD